MIKLAVLVPAIDDLECYEKHYNSLNNIFHNEIEFLYIIHLDIKKRENTYGTKKDFINLVNDLDKKYKNLECIFLCDEKHIGLNKTMHLLFSEFFKSSADFCVIIEDDSEITNKIYINEFLHLNENDTSLFRLSFATCSYSTENPFLIDNFKETDNHFIYKNNRYFCSLNGSFYSKRDVENILLNWNFQGEPENNIRLAKNILTLFIKSNNTPKLKNNINNVLFNLPKENHILLDDIRFKRRVGWNK